MTVTEIEVVETTKETLDDDICHLKCCVKMQAVCGTPVEEDGESDRDPSCVVCVDLGQGAIRHLAKTGHVHCPLNFAQICPTKKGKP